MNLPIISIVTPCLNPGEKLKSCIQSVAEQSYQGVEHIVVDGGSTDGTLEMLAETVRLKWISEPDTGQANAINKGFRMANGTILSWLNSDDLAAAGALEHVAAAFHAHPDVGWVYGNLQVVANGKTFKVKPPHTLGRKDLEFHNPIPQPATYVASWALEQVGWLDESFHLTMDMDLWLRLVNADIPAKYIPQTLATFEIHAGSKTGAIDRVEFMTEEFRAYMKNGMPASAAIAMGKVAAHSAAREGKVDRSRLDEEVLRLQETEAAMKLGREGLVHAAAITEAALIELRDYSFGGLRHLLSFEPWRFRETRARLFLTARRASRTARLPRDQKWR